MLTLSQNVQAITLRQAGVVSQYSIATSSELLLTKLLALPVKGSYRLYLMVIPSLFTDKSQHKYQLELNKINPTFYVTHIFISIMVIALYRTKVLLVL